MNTQQLIGDYFEDLLARMFKLKRVDSNFSHKEPDLSNEKFCIEVKSSKFDNGGVIKRRQLRYLENFHLECLYAFPYHELKTPIFRHYSSEKALLRAISLRSLYIFPLDVVKARYETGYKRPYPTDDDFVQIRESLASGIFDGDVDIWKLLHLTPGKYAKAHPKGTDIFIMAENKNTLDALLKGLTADYLAMGL
jgi:hypothetical protein